MPCTKEPVAGKLAKRNIYFPQASPSGRYVAYYGPENPATWRGTTYNGLVLRAPFGTALWIQDGKLRRLLTRVSAYADLVWSPDEQHLIALDIDTQVTGRDEEAGVLVATVWDVKSGRIVKQLNWRGPWTEIQPLYDERPKPRPLQLSDDGKLLYFLWREDPPAEGNMNKRVYALGALNLEDGSARPVAVLRGVAGVDWRPD